MPAAPTPELIAAAAHVFVEDLAAPALSQADVHHLARTLRLRPGEVVTASDGAGRWLRCIWTGAPAGPVACALLEVGGPVVSVAPALPAVTVGFAVTKGDRPESVVRGLSELGVDTIIPLATARCVVRWDAERAGRHLARLRRVAREAAMQSRRLWLPEVAPLTSVAGSATVGGAAGRATEGALGGPGSAVAPAGAEPAVSMAQPGGGPPSLDHPAILVGPEGGWDEAELACGLPLVGLGPGVLRAETAALVAGALLCALRAGVVLGATRA